MVTTSVVLLLYTAQYLTLYMPPSGTVILNEVKFSSTQLAATPVTAKQYKHYIIVIITSSEINPYCTMFSKSVHHFEYTIYILMKLYKNAAFYYEYALLSYNDGMYFTGHCNFISTSFYIYANSVTIAFDMY